MNSTLPTLLGATIMAGALCASATAQAPIVARIAAVKERASIDEQRARLLGALTFTKISLQLQDAPVRRAIHEIAAAAGIRIMGRYRDDQVGFGLDPEIPVTLEAHNQDALAVLEEVLAQCEPYDECTWQLRRGFVEVGTKERLSVPAAREMRGYDVRDLMIEPPTFKPGGGGARKTPLVIAVELVEEVVETIEPGRWDYGQSLETPDDDRLDQLPVSIGDGSPTDAPNPDRNAPNTTTTTAPTSTSSLPKLDPLPPRRQTGVPIWASIRVWREQLIVTAPDFIHRQLGGYPDPIPPAPTDAPSRSNPTPPDSGEH